jgi:PII-like signaling protein
LYSNNVEILRSNGTNGVTIFQNLSVTGEIRGNKAFRAVQGAPNDNNNSTNGYAFEVDGDTGIFSPLGPGGMGNGVVSTYSNDEEVLRVRAPEGIVFYYNLSSSDAAIRATVGAPNSNNLSTNGYGFGEDGDTGVFSPVLTAGANNGVVSLYSNSNEILRASGTNGVTIFHNLSVTGSIKTDNAFRAIQGAPNNLNDSTNGYGFGTDGDTGVFSPFGPGGNNNGNVSLYSNNVEILRANGTDGVTVYHNLSVTGTFTAGTPNGPIPIGSFSPTNASHDQTYICSPGAGVTVTITLPAGLNPGTQFSVIRAGDVGGFVEFTNAVGVAVPRSSPDNTFNNLAFVNSVASAYFAGTVDGTANVWYLLGDLLP